MRGFEIISEQRVGSGKFYQLFQLVCFRKAHTKTFYWNISYLSAQKKLFCKFRGADGTVGRHGCAAATEISKNYAAFEPLKAGGVWPLSRLTAGKIRVKAAAVAEQPVASSQ